MVARPAVAALFLALLFAPLPVMAQNTSDVVCATNAVPNPARESRYFCEPMDSTFFVQFDQFLHGLDALEAAYPDFIEVKTIGESALGLPIKFVEVTDENSAIARADKLQLGYSASIHANEPAGREGMTRVIEDLAGAKGPYGADLQPLLERMIVNVWFPNPDSWARGDFVSDDPQGQVTGILDGSQSVGYVRANANGYDLNRQFPNPGWILPQHEPMSQPEVRPVVEELRYSGNHSSMVAAADLHGMLQSPNMIRSIIPNQDYDFRRMVLVVDQLRQMDERITANPSFTEWNALALVGATFEDAIGAAPCVGGPNIDEACLPAGSAPIDKPFLWGARWDQIGYTDTGFTSDYLTLSPRSPTGGMGAVGQIVEFAYSHQVPDNKYVAKLVDMHVAGVREIVRTQMEQAFRLDTPVLADTGTVGYAWVDDYVTSDDDPRPYGWNADTRSWDKPEFNKDDPDAKFDFRQVAYNVSNLNFWRDLGRYSEDEFRPIDARTIAPEDLEDLSSFTITDQAIDGFSDYGISVLRQWVEEGGHLFLTDGAIQFFDRSALTADAAVNQCVYIGHSDLRDRDHPLLAGVDWNARVTGETSAIGIGATEGDARNYPQWGLTLSNGLDLDIVGTTGGAGGGGLEASSDPVKAYLHGDHWDGPRQAASVQDVDTCTATTQDAQIVSLGRARVGSGTIDFIGGALPRPVQDYDHRYGLADYSVSALTYWVVMNSLGGRIELAPILEPFIPTYDYDPVYGTPAKPAPAVRDNGSKDSPSAPLLAVLAALAAAVLIARRR